MHLLKLFAKIVSLAFLLVFVSISIFIIIGYFVASKPISYLPDTHSSDLNKYTNVLNHIELKGSNYLLFVDKNGRVGINTIKGEVVLSNLTYYSSYEGSNEKWGLDNISARLISDSTISIDGEGQMGVLVNLFLTVPKNKPRLDVKIKTRYNKSTVIRRESLVLGFDVPVSEVYRKNRQVDVEPFEAEYWLQRQGARFGNGHRSALIYHTPFVSSLQLDTKNNLLFVNLEYYLDHPFMHIPLQEDGGGKWVNLSNAKYLAGDERDNNFSIYLGGNPNIIPRIMLVPHGYLAGYVFTEHADEGNIRTHRAAYFGAEDISCVDNAVGGFVGHKIPVTKSVFYSDAGDLPGSTIKGDPDSSQLLDFIDQLYKTGNYEICLHTPDETNSNREVLEESIKFMKNRFDTRTWIDHGMFSGQENRECIVADGLNPNSEFYTADLWEKYDTRYFWCSAVEVSRESSLMGKLKKLRLYDAFTTLWERNSSPEELNKMGFFTSFKEMVRRYEDKGELNSLRPNKGNTFPTPLFWQHLTQTRNFYSWVTDYPRRVNNLSEKKVNNEQKLFNKLISDGGVFINHGYFVRDEINDDILCMRDGKLVINPYYDKILGIMAKMRDEGDLYITTIRDLMNYWILSEKISFNHMPDGVIYITNGNDKPISGLSMVVHANMVRINGEIPKFRRIGEDTIFWFDIPAKRSVSLEIE
jgi:hypothetical protein